MAFLPQLAAAAGIPKERVIWILMLDQAIFIAMDLALGVSADRVAAAMRRISTPMIAITAVSAGAFVLLPQAGASAGLLLSLTVIWAGYLLGAACPADGHVFQVCERRRRAALRVFVAARHRHRERDCAVADGAPARHVADLAVRARRARVGGGGAGDGLVRTSPGI